jgi:gas vesicle protein
MIIVLIASVGLICMLVGGIIGFAACAVFTVHRVVRLRLEGIENEYMRYKG